MTSYQGKSLGRGLQFIFQEDNRKLQVTGHGKDALFFAFSKSPKLCEVVLPEGITLDYACFAGCDKWKDIFLPRDTVCYDAALPQQIERLEICRMITGDAVLFGTIQKFILCYKFCKEKQNKVFCQTGR